MDNLRDYKENGADAFNREAADVMLDEALDHIAELERALASIVDVVNSSAISNVQKWSLVRAVASSVNMDMLFFKPSV